MLIAATADLHYGKSTASDSSVRELAEKLASKRPDVLIIAGDVAIADPRATVECLRLFADVASHRFVIPGNHDIWSSDRSGAADSRDIFERLFSRSAMLGGFHRLDVEPRVVDGVGFAGSIGWYDYAFADPELDVPRSVYEKKSLPGVGRWNDGRFVRWDYTDEEFLDITLERLTQDIRRVADKSTKLVITTHHLPFADLVVRRKFPAWMFQNAYMGSPRIGELIRSSARVPTLGISGHSHQFTTADLVATDGTTPIRAVNVGTTYHRKRALLFDSDREFEIVETVESGTEKRRDT